MAELYSHFHRIARKSLEIFRDLENVSPVAKIKTKANMDKCLKCLAALDSGGGSEEPDVKCKKEA